MLLGQQYLPKAYRNMDRICCGMQPSHGTWSTHVPQMVGRSGAQTCCACKTGDAHVSHMKMLLCTFWWRQVAETNAAVRSQKRKNNRIAACDTYTTKTRHAHDSHMNSEPRVLPQQQLVEACATHVSNCSYLSLKVPHIKSRN